MILSLVNFAFSLQTEDQIELDVTQDDHYATIRVTAAGATISPEQLAELFELVVRLDAAGRSELGRGGLALPLTQKLAQMHQGLAWAESEANVGARLYLKLPLHQTRG
jgi:signal transduction histidine kinase